MSTAAQVTSPEERARLGADLRRRREERGWSRLTLAQRAGVSVSSIPAIEGGGVDPQNSRVFQRLHDALDAA
jgi:predicted transcriptional regulator